MLWWVKTLTECRPPLLLPQVCLSLRWAPRPLFKDSTSFLTSCLLPFHVHVIKHQRILLWFLWFSSPDGSRSRSDLCSCCLLCLSSAHPLSVSSLPDLQPRFVPVSPHNDSLETLTELTWKFRTPNSPVMSFSSESWETERRCRTQTRPQSVYKKSFIQEKTNCSHRFISGAIIFHLEPFAVTWAITLCRVGMMVCSYFIRNVDVQEFIWHKQNTNAKLEYEYD